MLAIIIILAFCILVFYIIMSNGINNWCKGDLGLSDCKSEFFSTFWPIFIVPLLLYSLILVFLGGKNA